MIRNVIGFISSFFVSFRWDYLDTGVIMGSVSNTSIQAYKNDSGIYPEYKNDSEIYLVRVELVFGAKHTNNGNTSMDYI